MVVPIEDAQGRPFESVYHADRSPAGPPPAAVARYA
jgi:hypothetical protein